MEFTIIDEPNEKLIVKPGDNDTVVILQKRLSDYSKQWNSKVIILNRREAGLVCKAMSNIMTNSQRIFAVAPR